MGAIVELADLWKSATATEDRSVMVELDGSVASAEALWRMVLAMALKDRAWCIQYDVRHPWRLMYVTSWQMYGLVPPPDEMADLLVRAIDRITRPNRVVGGLLAGAKSSWATRMTRSFLVRHVDETVPWVASWPRQASQGPIVVFRETYPGPDPSLTAPSES